MEFKIYTYLQDHPYQKMLVKWWLKQGLFIPEKIKRQIINQIHAEMISRMMEAVDSGRGINFDDAMRLHYELGREFAPVLFDILSLNPNDARSLTRIVEFINALADIKGNEIKSARDQVVRHEKYCFLSEQLTKCGVPYYCMLFQSMYKGLLYELNPDAKANDLLVTQSSGHKYCEIITSIEKDTDV